jgi:outer membrane protein assembly factor BamB
VGILLSLCAPHCRAAHPEKKKAAEVWLEQRKVFCRRRGTRRSICGGGATVVGEVVYVGNLANQLCAIGAKDGHEQWCFDAGHPLNDISLPAVVNGTAYAGSTDGNVYALDAATGGLRWGYATKNGYVDGPAVVDGVVYAPSWDNNLYALDSATGFLLLTGYRNQCVSVMPVTDKPTIVRVKRVC